MNEQNQLCTVSVRMS